MQKYLPDINEWQFYDKNNNILPWYASGFLDIMLTWDVSSWNVYEYGSGWSTIWWAKHCRKLISIEHNEDWYENCKKQILQENLQNVEMHFANQEKYVNSIDDYGSEKFDCIIVDGLYRLQCLAAALRHIKSNGFIILDDSERHIDSYNCLPTNEFSLHASMEELNILRYNECHTYLYEGSTLSRTTYWKIKNNQNIITDAYAETLAQIERLRSNPSIQYKL